MTEERRGRGRPRVYEDGGVTIGIYCSPDLREALHKEAERCGISPSKLGADALTTFLSARVKARAYLDNK
jgi:hypothetical protein